MGTNPSRLRCMVFHFLMRPRQKRRYPWADLPGGGSHRGRIHTRELEPLRYHRCKPGLRISLHPLIGQWVFGGASSA